MAATITKQRAEVEGSLYELQRLQEKAERYEMQRKTTKELKDVLNSEYFV